MTAAPHASPTAPQLIEHILATHHSLLKRELPRLGAALHDRELQAVFSELVMVLSEHMMKEEVILFPMVLALAAGEGASGCGVLGPVKQMGHEHGLIRELETRLRSLSARAGHEESALIALLDDLARHAATEDDQLFPLALALEAAALGAPESRNESDEDAVPDARSVASPPPSAGRRLTIRHTRSCCPQCLRELPASVYIEEEGAAHGTEGGAWLGRTCPEHGEQR